MSALVSLFKAVLMASWQGSLAIGLVLLARQALGARAPARWRYLLWVLVLVRLLAPAVTLPHNPASLQNIPVVARPFELAPQTASEPPTAVLPAPALPLPAPRFPGWDYTPLCLVNSVPMAELLKKAGGDVRAKLFGRNTSILTYVVVWSKPEVVAWFLDQWLDPKMIGDNDETLLFDLREARTAELLLDRGVDPNRPIFSTTSRSNSPAKLSVVSLPTPT